MKHKLQTHFFLTYFFMAMIVVLLFSIFFFQYTSEILIERETKSLQELNNSFLSRTDAELRETTFPSTLHTAAGSKNSCPSGWTCPPPPMNFGI